MGCGGFGEKENKEEECFQSFLRTFNSLSHNGTNSGVVEKHPKTTLTCLK
jgi:hypothetical protein